MAENTEMQSNPETYDAFLAHSSKDGVIVQKVLKELEDRGIKCCYSKRDFLPGQNLLYFMENAVCTSRVTIAFFSQDFLESPFCKLERDFALQRALEVDRQVLIPLLLDVDVASLPISVRRLTCLSLEKDDYLPKLLEVMGVADHDTRPTYNELKLRVQTLEKEKNDFIQESKAYRFQAESQLQEKEKKILQLQEQNTDLRIQQEIESNKAKKMGYELDECKHQVSVMEERLQEKEELISQQQRENGVLEHDSTENRTSGSQPTVLDTYWMLKMVENKMEDTTKDDTMIFFRNVLILLHTLINRFPADNTVLKKVHIAVLMLMGDKEQDNDKALNYCNQALETVKELHGANTAHVDTAWIMYWTADHLRRSQSYQAARDVFNQTLQMCNKLEAQPGNSVSDIQHITAMIDLCKILIPHCNAVMTTRRIV